MFRLRLQQRINGSANPPPVNDYEYTSEFVEGPDALGLPDDLGSLPADAGTPPQQPDLPATAAARLRESGALPPSGTVVGINPSPREVDAQLSRACNLLNTAQQELQVARTDSHVDMTVARAEVRTALQTARGLLDEATHPSDRQGVQGNYRIATQLHPGGVTVTQIQQRLRTLEGELARLPSNNLVAAAGTGSPAPSASPTPPRPVAVRTTGLLDALMDGAIRHNPARDLAQSFVHPQPPQSASVAPQPVAARPSVSAPPPPPSVPVGVLNDMDMLNQNLRSAGGARASSERTYFVGQAQTYVERARPEFERFCAANHLNNDSPVTLTGGQQSTVGQVRAELAALGARYTSLSNI
ncbi:MAG: hypothetical protein HQM15_10320 [Deltaproteobacteria bacterium]|nr:hypothetical protein [Deltaproteobacteria bacterium]